MKSHFEPKLAFTLKEAAKIIFGSDSRSEYQKVLRLVKNKVIESITFPGNGGRVYVPRKALLQLMGDEENFDSLIKKITK
tara:strand:- start:1778 stop:2017 length:240 start_codon:yes stop_codon:yes gene_type:complete